MKEQPVIDLQFPVAGRAVARFRSVGDNADTTDSAGNQMIPRLSRRRSRSDNPPQIPNRSSLASA
ncbi:hypothetical protein ABH922_002901 [Rhodococcus sp. 27YEA15]